jgi:DNA-directed RNA polymerase subunit M/transcription elongation factor TFIIS
MDPQTLVWVKMDGYPWWPAVVADHESSGIDIPEGKDALVQFLGSGDAGFISSTDANEVAMFQPDTDADKIQGSDADEGCAQAVQEALGLWSAALEAATVGGADALPDGDAEDSSSNDDADVAREHDVITKREKKEKKHKKEKKSKKEKREKKKEKRRREHNSSDDEEDAREVERSRRKQAHREMRQQEEKQADNRQIMNQQSARQHAVLTTKRNPSMKELCKLRDDLESAIEEIDQPAARSILSQLAKLHVTYSQLKTTRIGVMVGQLLSQKGFPFCRLLASAILKYWFVQLPSTHQRRLTAQDRIELASRESIEGSDRDVNEEMSKLSAFGVQLERCFMAEEDGLLLAEQREADVLGSPVAGDLGAPTFDDAPDTILCKRLNPPVSDAPTLVPASHIALVMEKCLQGDEVHPEGLQQFLLNYFSNSDNRQMRVDLLTGAQSPEACVQQIAELFLASIRDLNRQQQEQVLDETIEDEYENVSHLFTCPECGAASASTSDMMTGSHGEDHTMVVWATCTKCHHGWTVGGDN